MRYLSNIADVGYRDVPLNIISQYGGFLNASVVEDFNHYASIVFQRYGNKVKTWFTFNEPQVGAFPVPFFISY